MQTHSTNVSFCSTKEYVENCDGTFTNEGKKICSIQVADCMPIFFAHLTEKVYGIVHVGWRGLVNGILDNSADLLVREDYKLSDFEIFIGPPIQNCCFEVGDDIINKFEQIHNLEQIVEEEEKWFDYGLQKLRNNIYFPGFFIIFGERINESNIL